MAQKRGEDPPRIFVDGGERGEGCFEVLFANAIEERVD